MPDEGRYAYSGLERIFHEKARLSILTSLAANKSGLLFPDLKEMCALTDGNLARHLQALQEAELILVKKSPGRTHVRMSASGRKRFVAYLEELERVVRDAAQRRQGLGRQGLEGDRGKGRGKGDSGWATA